MNTSEGASPPSPKSALDQFKEWKELISVIAAVLVSVLGGIFGQSQVQTVSWGLAFLIVGVGAWWVRRSWLRKHRRAEKEKLWIERQAQPRKAAFRSLAPFEEGDDLPGRDRKQQGRSIGTRIASDDFRFGIVCGNSGCGKTSLLGSEVARTLRTAGFQVIYLRNPRRLNKIGGTGTPRERMAAELDSLEKEQFPRVPCVLILDQFEELFLEYREPETRSLVGSFIRRLTERSPAVRVVAAVRQEFLVDFHDLAEELSDPTSPNTTFKVRNLTIPQAIDVINECAVADGLSLDESFAQTIAKDLAEAEEVRPPELQIVCTYLAEVGGLTTPRYLSFGGTAGILAHYIKDAVDSSRAPEVGARLLRALCDFPARAKQKPKTVDDLLADVGPVASATAEQRKTLIIELARHFVLARVLAVEKKRIASDAFVLIHDYLVDAIQLATSNTSTQTEEANQLLRYYLAEGRGTIPLRKLRLIISYADVSLRRETKARHLIRRSRVAPVLSVSVMGLVALLVAGGLYLLATAGLQWKHAVIARHWVKGELGTVSASAYPESERVVTIGWKSHVRAWDSKTGKLLRTIDNPKQENTLLSPKGSYVLFSPTDLNRPTEVRVVNIGDGTEVVLPKGVRYEFSDDERWITYSARGSTGGEEYDALSPSIYSLAEKRLVRTFSNFPSADGSFSYSPPYEFSEDGEWLGVRTLSDDRIAVQLFNVASGRKAITLPNQIEPNLFSFHTLTARVSTVVENSTTHILIQIWHFHDGTLVRERRIPWVFSIYDSVAFSGDGSHLLLSKEDPLADNRGVPVVLRVSDLEPGHGVPSNQMHLATSQKYGDPVLWWNAVGGVKVWEVGNHSAIQLAGLKLDEEDKMGVSTHMRYAVTWGEGRKVELWNLLDGRLIAVLDHTGQEVSDALFTVEDTAVMIVEEGGLCSLFTAREGAPLAKRFAGGGHVIWYDPALGRFHLWNWAGQIVRYVEGRSYFGKFVPMRAGASK